MTTRAESLKLRDWIKDKRACGMALEDIAAAVGVSRGTVSYHLRQLGIRCNMKRRRARGGCPICGVQTDFSPSHCASEECTRIAREAYNCDPPSDRPELLLRAQSYHPGVNIPQSASVCRLRGDFRVFHSFNDHVRYHAYISGRRGSMPGALVILRP